MRDEKFFCQIGANDERERIQALRLLYFGDGFAVSPQCGQMPGIPMVTRRVARIQFDSAPEFIPRRLPIPVVAI